MKAARAPEKTKKAAAGVAPREELAEQIFALMAGIWIGLTLVKLGNPVIFERMVTPPKNFAEFIFITWPISWGYVMCAAVVIASLKVLRFRWRPDYWPLLLLGAWLFWQFLSATRTVSKPLTSATLPHFVVCGVSVLLGWLALSRVRLGPFFWTPIMLCFFYTLFSGFDQHHGGLEAMRKSFYEQPNWQMYPKEYLAKMTSNRIFGTFVYPNALAGAILLLLPVCLWQGWNLTAKWPRVARGVISGLLLYLGLGCLYWTGSKGGWLIALLMTAVWLLHLQFPKKLKMIFVVAGLALGLTAFFIRFSGYFEKGATSVSARFTYWSAALNTIRENPIFGTGPGTFSVAYGRIKPADAEMAKLAHNDYLEQASDSGIVGGLTFAGFVLISLYTLYRTARQKGWAVFMIWLGLLGWAAQGFIEFGLYIPGLAWPAFLFLGWLWGIKEPLETTPIPPNP